MLRAVLDFIYRIQRWVIGAAVLAPIALGALLGLYVSTAVGYEFVPYALLRGPLLYFAVLIPLLAVILLHLWSGLGPVPEAANLDLPPLLRSGPGNKHLLVFLHGWRGDSVGTWKSFSDLIVTDDRFALFDIAGIDYPTYMFRRSLDLPAFVSWLLDRMRRDHLLSSYQAIAIIAHSFGGLVARELYLQSRLADDAARIVVIVGIGTPHRGADLAKLAASLGIGSKLVRDAAPGSDFLSALKTHWNAVRTRPHTHGISSPEDDVVDEDSAHFLCDRMSSYPRWGHRELVKPESHADDRYSKPTAIVLDAIRHAENNAA